MLQLSKYLIALCVILVLISCKGESVLENQDVSVTKESGEFSPSSNDTLQYLFYIAQSLERRGDSLPALGAYEQAYRFDSSSNFLTQKITTLGLALHKPGTVIRVLQGGKKLAELPDSTIRVITSVYTHYQVYDAALIAHMQLDSMSLDDSLQMLSLYERTQKYTEAIDLYGVLFPDMPDEVLLKVADLHRLDGQFIEAESRYRTIIMNNPDIEGAAEGLALTLMASGKTDEGVSVLKRVIAEGENNGVNNILARDVLGSYLWSIGDLDSAITIYKPLYTGSGSSEDLRFGRTLGVYYYVNKEYAKAVSIFEQLLEYPLEDIYEIFYLYGTSQQALGNFKEAEDAYLSSVKIKGDFLDAQRALALLYLDSERISEATTAALTLTTDFPENSSGWALVGAIYNMQKKYTEALPYLEKAVSIIDTNIPILFEYGMALERTSAKDSAETIFRQLLILDSSHSGTANYLGYMWAEDNKNLEEAKVLIEQALLSEPENGAFLDSYGWVLYRLGDYEQALRYLLKSIQLMPNEDFIIYVHAGDVLKAMGRHQEANDYYEKAKLIDGADLELLQKKLDSQEDDSFIQKKKLD